MARRAVIEAELLDTTSEKRGVELVEARTEDPTVDGEDGRVARALRWRRSSGSRNAWRIRCSELSTYARPATAPPFISVDTASTHTAPSAKLAR